MRGITPELRALAQRQRGEMTAAERALWECLKDRRLDGLRFRAQHPVGRFILDFYCPACRLVVEVDGPIHDSRQPEDAERTRALQAHGYHVVRVRNETVFADLPGVLRDIANAARLCE
ncbi:MAG: DUF559 domain-containing protein [Chloroflexi bacterium]|nr:DUF559 domain-containing protein [Chloroflexota bacterium]